MKQYVIVKRAKSKTMEDEVLSKIYTDENINVAWETIRQYNFLKGNGYEYELVELTSLVRVKLECDMTEEEKKDYIKTLNEMGDDLDDIIDYDEWAGREFGETRVDYWYTAKNLYTAGYRKITKVEE